MISTMKKILSMITTLMFVLSTYNIITVSASRIAVPTSPDLSSASAQSNIQGLTVEQSNALYQLQNYIVGEKWGFAYSLCDIMINEDYDMSDEDIASFKESLRKLRNITYELYCTRTLPIRNAYRDILTDYAFANLDVYEKPKYFIYDINKDKIPELIIRAGTCEADYQFHYYTFSNSSAVLLGQYPAMRSSLYQNPNNNGIMRIGGAQGYGSVSLIELTNSALSERIIKEGQLEDLDLDRYDSLLLEECEIIYSSALDDYFGTTKKLDSYDDGTKPLNIAKDFFGKELYLECIESVNIASQFYHLSEGDNTVLTTLKAASEWNYNLFINQLNQQINQQNETLAKSYIDQGLYVEAIQICDYVINNSPLPEENLQIFYELKYDAQTKYNAYINKQINSPISDSVKRTLWNKYIEIINEHIYAPLTTIFPSYTQITYYRESVDTIRLKGYYDTQNVMGVYYRGRFTALCSNDLRILSYKFN